MLIRQVNTQRTQKHAICINYCNKRGRRVCYLMMVFRGEIRYSELTFCRFETVSGYGFNLEADSAAFIDDWFSANFPRGLESMDELNEWTQNQPQVVTDVDLSVGFKN